MGADAFKSKRAVLALIFAAATCFGVGIWAGKSIFDKSSDIAELNVKLERKDARIEYEMTERKAAEETSVKLSDEISKLTRYMNMKQQCLTFAFLTMNKKEMKTPKDPKLTTLGSD